MNTVESKMGVFGWLFDERWNWIIVLLIVELVCLWGDYCLKKASMEQNWEGWRLILAGCFLYAVSAIGFFYLMRSFKVFTLGVLHSFAVILLSVILSLVVFNEKINAREILGLILGIISIVLLVRFQE